MIFLAIRDNCFFCYFRDILANIARCKKCFFIKKLCSQPLSCCHFNLVVKFIRNIWCFDMVDNRLRAEMTIAHSKRLRYLLGTLMEKSRRGQYIAISSIWLGNMLGYLSADIVCSEKRTVSQERSSSKTASFEEQIMSEDKYPNIFFKVKLGLLCLILRIVFATRGSEKWGTSLGYSVVLAGEYSVT